MVHHAKGKHTRSCSLPCSMVFFSFGFDWRAMGLCVLKLSGTGQSLVRGADACQGGGERLGMIGVRRVGRLLAGCARVFPCFRGEGGNAGNLCPVGLASCLVGAVLGSVHTPFHGLARLPRQPGKQVSHCLFWYWQNTKSMLFGGMPYFFVV